MNNDIKYIFLITVDCLRADHIGYIGGRSLTPNIDRLAGNSVVFTRVFANGPTTQTSFPSILTSTYFLIHRSLRIAPDFITLAEVFRCNGFRTAAFHSNPFLSKKFGWDRGFHDFYDFLDKVSTPTGMLVRNRTISNIIKKFNLNEENVVIKFMRNVYYKAQKFKMPYVDGAVLNKYVFDWILRNKGNNFFILVHYMDPHEPFIPPDNYLQNTPFNTRIEAFRFNIDCGLNPSKEQLKILKLLYELEIKYVDDCIGRLLSFLEEHEMLKNALIILTADHGQEFGEHGNFGHLSHSLYNEVLNVPLIIHGFNNNGISKEFTSLINIGPTILDLIGIKKPKEFMGESIVDIINEENINKSAIFFAESAKFINTQLTYDLRKKAIACFVKPWKLILNDITGRVELYNIEKDWEEKLNLIEEEKDVATKLMSLIHNHLKKENFFIRIKKVKTALESVYKNYVKS
jgi:arylsulfatase A-like enzyme